MILMVHFPNLITETNYLYKFLKDHLTQTAEKLCISHFPQVKDNWNEDPSHLRVLFAFEFHPLQAQREYNIEMYKCTTFFSSLFSEGRWRERQIDLCHVFFRDHLW